MKVLTLQLLRTKSLVQALNTPNGLPQKETYEIYNAISGASQALE